MPFELFLSSPSINQSIYLNFIKNAKLSSTLAQNYEEVSLFYELK